MNFGNPYDYANKGDRLNAILSSYGNYQQQYTNPSYMTNQVAQPYMQQPINPQQMQNPIQNQTTVNNMFYDCKPVTSIDEAKAQSVKIDGTPTYLVDIGNKKIYEKKLNMNDGSAIFNVYQLTENNENQSNAYKNIDLSEMLSIDDLVEINKKIELLTQKDDEILSNLQNVKMIGVDNIESNANNVVSTRKSSGTTTKSSK